MIPIIFFNNKESLRWFLANSKIGIVSTLSIDRLSSLLSEIKSKFISAASTTPDVIRSMLGEEKVIPPELLITNNEKIVWEYPNYVCWPIPEDMEKSIINYIKSLDLVEAGADILLESAMKAVNSPHIILGVSKDATKEEIEKAYKELAKECHPDVVTSRFKKYAEEEMKKINNARDEMLKGK